MTTNEEMGKTASEGVERSDCLGDRNRSNFGQAIERQTDKTGELDWVGAVPSMAEFEVNRDQIEWSRTGLNESEIERLANARQRREVVEAKLNSQFAARKLEETKTQMKRLLTHIKVLQILLLLVLASSIANLFVD